MDQNESKWIKMNQIGLRWIKLDQIVSNSINVSKNINKDKKDIKWVSQKKREDDQKDEKIFLKNGSKKNKPVFQKHPIVRLVGKNSDWNLGHIHPQPQLRDCTINLLKWTKCPGPRLPRIWHHEDVRLQLKKFIKSQC